MSTLAYGVITTCWPPTAVLSEESQPAAALLAGSGAAPLQLDPESAKYPLVIVVASLSSAGSMIQVRWAPGWLSPASRSADGRPPRLRLATRSSFASAEHT